MPGKPITAWYSDKKHGKFPNKITITKMSPFHWHINCLLCGHLIMQGTGHIENYEHSHHDFNHCMKNCKANIAGKDN